MSGRTFEQWAALCGYRQGTLSREHAQNGYQARQPEIDALRVEVERLRTVLSKCQNALEPYDDIKPRDWFTDREKLRIAHQAIKAAMKEQK